ncbi:MAG TPA: hypothetical protein VMU09_01930 [Acidimicrobiales bacterium]|nr:hypothetical protein [Acidimicrobiales bacterium]
MKTGDLARESGEFSAECGHWMVRVKSGGEFPPCPQCHQVVQYRRVGGLPAAVPVGVAAGTDGRRSQQEFWGRGDTEYRVGRSGRSHHRLHLEIMGRSALREGRRRWARATRG